MIHLNKNSSTPALKIKCQNTPLTINQITRNLNIFRKKKKRCYYIFPLLYIWPSLSRGHYLDDGLWKVKAEYIVKEK